MKIEEFSNNSPEQLCKLLQPNHIKISRRKIEFDDTTVKTLIRFDPCSTSHIEVFLFT